MIATIEAFQTYGMIESNWARGEQLRGRLSRIVMAHGLSGFIEVKGDPCLLLLVCRNDQGNVDDAFRTLLMQEMIARGVLFQGMLYPTWSHQAAELEWIAAAFDESCEVYRRAIERGNVHGLLAGPPAKPVFRRKI